MAQKPVEWPLMRIQVSLTGKEIDLFRWLGDNHKNGWVTSLDVDVTDIGIHHVGSVWLEPSIERCSPPRAFW